MTEFEIETLRKLRDHANRPENYEKGWDVIAEAFTDSELLELFTGDTEEEIQLLREVLDDPSLQPLAPAENYTEAKRRVQRIVDMHEEQRRVAINEIW
jgi:hypothetical protein